jgi:hypothetical protein
MAAASPGPLLDETETTTSLLDPWFFGGKSCSTSTLTKPWAVNGYQRSSVSSVDIIIVRAGVTLPLVGPTSGSNRVLVPFAAAPSHPPRLLPPPTAAGAAGELSAARCACCTPAVFMEKGRGMISGGEAIGPTCCFVCGAAQVASAPLYACSRERIRRWRRCSLASLFVQGLGPSVGKQLSLVLTELAVFVCDVCDGCVANLGALLATQYRRARASSESEDDRPGRERRE